MVSDRRQCAALLGFLLLIALGPFQAQATVTTFTDSASYFVAAGPQQLQDFNSPISVTPGTSTASIKYPDLVVSCTATAFADCSRTFGLATSVTIDGFSIFDAGITDLSFTFNSPITSFGIFIAGLGTLSPGSATLSVSNSNGFSTDLFVDYVGTTTSFDTPLFAGLISSDRFTSVTFVDSELGDGIFFDHLSFSRAVPEPSSLILMLTGLGGLGRLAGAGRHSVPLPRIAG